MSGNVSATDAPPLCHAICDKLNNPNKYGKNDVGSFDGRIANCWQANFILSNSPLHGIVSSLVFTVNKHIPLFLSALL